MNFKLIRGLLVSLLLLVAVEKVASAGILIEPTLAYESSEQKLTTLSGTDQGGKTTGLVLGGRLGYAIPLIKLWVALDASIMSGGSYSGNSASNNGKVNRNNVYLDVGWDLPILARVWLGYGISNTNTLKADVGSSTDLKKGSEYKVGFGLTAFPMVSLNFEYFAFNYGEYSSGSTSGTTDSVWATHTDSGMMLGVSVPFNL